MKEAAGEANLTVIAILLIGVIAAVATPLISSMMTSSAKKACCQNYGGIWEQNKCFAVTANGSRGAEIAAATFWNEQAKTCN